MHRLRTGEDPARRWRQFCRTGWRRAGLGCAVWAGALALLFRIAPAPAPVARPEPARCAWWPAPAGAALDVRAHWTPAPFALATPAGFSHALRDERTRLAPPVQAERPGPAFLPPPARPPRPLLPPPPEPAAAGPAAGGEGAP